MTIFAQITLAPLTAEAKARCDSAMKRVIAKIGNRINAESYMRYRKKIAALEVPLPPTEHETGPSYDTIKRPYLAAAMLKAHKSSFSDVFKHSFGGARKDNT